MLSEDARLPSESSRRDTLDLIRGTCVNLLGMAARSLRGLATLLATNLFGAAVYGLYDTSWKIIYLFYKLARFGLQQTVVRAVIEERSSGDRRGAHHAIAAGVVIAAISGSVAVVLARIAAPHIASFYGHGDLLGTIRLMAWALPFMSLSAVLVASTWAIRIMRYDVYVNSVGFPLFLLTGTLIAGMGGWGLRGLAWTSLLAGMGILAQAAIYFQRHFSFGECARNIWLKKRWGALVRFSLPVMLSDILRTLEWSVDQLILLKYTSPESVGIYAVARQVSIFMKKMPQAFIPMYSSIVADLSYQERPQNQDAHLTFIFRWVFVVNLAYLGLFYMAGGHLLGLFGSGFSSGLTVVWVLCLGMIPYGMALPLETQLVMSGHPYLNFADYTLWISSLLALLFWLIPSHGALGAAWASTLSIFLVTAVRLVQVYFLQKIQPFRLQLLKPFAAALTGVAGGKFVEGLAAPPWSAILAALVFLALFVLALVLQKFEAEDRIVLDRLLRRFKPSGAPGAEHPTSGLDA